MKHSQTTCKSPRRSGAGGARSRGWPPALGWRALGCTALLGAFACGDRDARHELSFSDGAALGLRHAVVLGDDPLQRVLVLQSQGLGDLSTHELPVGRHRVSMVADVTGERLLVLSAGVQPRLQDGDELPSLTLIDTRGEPRVEARYELSVPFSTLTQDPQGRWVVLSGAEETLVTNPNQLVLIDLSDPDYVPFTKTIRSFGSAPERFQFSEPLNVPGGPRRFLIAQTRQDVTIVDLEELERPEITVALPRTASGAAGKPLEVVVHPGSPGASDARLAIRMENDANVVLVDFKPAEGGSHPFRTTPNLVDVGGPPSALDFVATDGGLRLAALVPGRLEAALVNPETTRVDYLALPHAFDRLRKVAGSGSAAADVALLWSQLQSSVAVWSLGSTEAQAFRSIEVLTLDAQVREVLDVPGDALGQRKLLQAPDSRFFVLDLERRQSFPMLSSGALTLRVADDGLRAWAFQPGSQRLAQIDLGTLAPTSLFIEQPISQVFDVASDTDEARTLVALHDVGMGAVTLLDARAPDTAQTRFYPGLLLGGER